MNPISATAHASTPQPGLTLHTRAERILLPGLLMGIAGDYLLREGPHGPGLVAWLALLAVFAISLARSAGISRLRSIALWSTVAITAAFVTTLRDLEGLIPAMLLVILLCAVITSLETSGIGLRAAQVRDYLVTGFFFPLQMLMLTPRVLHQADLHAVTRNERAPQVVRGVLFAIPALLIFGLLFAAADAGFSQYLSAITKVISPPTLQHLLVGLTFAWLATSLLGIACRVATPNTALPASTAPLRVGATETHVMLALVSTLFAAFVLLQLRYLFGGTNVIVNTSGLTVAEYARRGFFELVVVSALTLAFLFGVSLTDCAPRILRRYGLVLIACVLVILVSALQRLFLYTDTFGMTIERFSALAAIAWLVFNLFTFSATILRGDIRGFASGIAISGIGCLLLLGLVNPAGMVTRINLERSIERNLPLDASYLVSLGADAVPLVLERYDELDARQQCDLARGLLFEYPLDSNREPVPERDWRYWNVARDNAKQAVSARADELYSAVGVQTRFELANLFENTCGR